MFSLPRSGKGSRSGLPNSRSSLRVNTGAGGPSTPCRSRCSPSRAEDCCGYAGAADTGAVPVQDFAALRRRGRRFCHAAASGAADFQPRGDRRRCNLASDHWESRASLAVAFFLRRHCASARRNAHRVPGLPPLRVTLPGFRSDDRRDCIRRQPGVVRLWWYVGHRHGGGHLLVPGRAQRHRRVAAAVLAGARRSGHQDESRNGAGIIIRGIGGGRIADLRPRAVQPCGGCSDRANPVRVDETDGTSQDAVLTSPRPAYTGAEWRLCLAQYRGLPLLPPYSTFAPERRMISAHFAFSARTNPANSPGVMTRASMPRLAMRRATSGCASSRAVPERAPRPSHGVASKPGSPDSATVGISGAAAMRFSSATAIARSRPSRTYWSVVLVLTKPIATRPARRSVVACAADPL